MDNSSQYKFTGVFEHGVDDKGRVVLPLEYREQLGVEFIATHGPDKAIWLLTIAKWNDIQRKIDSDESLDMEAGYLHRLLFSGKTLLKLDSQFRLAIPKHLREYAEIALSTPSSIIGVGRHIEIWSKTNWMEFNKTNFNSSRLKDAAAATGVFKAVMR